MMSLAADDSEEIENNGDGSSQVRVVSFDLDNTLWKTGPTIQAANDALAKYLSEMEIVQPERVEKVMGRLFELSKATYSPLIGDDAKSPTLLTKLRTDALRFVLEENNGYSNEDAIAEADRAFEVWTAARHEALPQYFAESVIPCLKQIRSIVSSSAGQPVLIGAITDGNSDPRTVPVLKQFFDFVVNAESVGISKPDKRVYMAAIKEVAVHPYVKDIFDDDTILEDEDLLEQSVGPWWVHIGDDFLKDIVAAKDLGMRSIWAKELVQEKVEKETVPKEPKKSVEDFVKEVSNKLAENNVVEMAVGAEDYLAESLEAEFADATVYTFAEVGKTLVAWHTLALPRKLAPANTEEEAVAGVEPSPSQPTETAKQPAIAAGDSKFCMACGTKLPVDAKFCSSCGEKQA
jgi:FMN phosphatase YigB (HAD superfamily)